MSDNHAFGRPNPEEARGVVETMRTENSTISNNFNAVMSCSKSSVQHLEEHSQSFGELFVSADHADVTIVLDDGTEFSSHRLILAVRSSFFRAMLYNGFQESHQKRVALHETNSTAFRAVLQYMYTSKIDFAGVELDILLEYLSLAHRFDLNQLMNAIKDANFSVLDTNIIPQYPNVQPLSRDLGKRYSPAENITVFHLDLGKPFIINTILMDFNWKNDVQSFSYQIHVGMENRVEGHWKLVADYSDYDCRGIQRVFLPDTVVRYILIRVNDPMTSRLEASRIEAMYSSETMIVDPISKIIIPHRNITTIENHARVVEGVSRCRNALINGDITSYDWDSGYTCHQIGSGLIMIQLAQPYIISSMRLLLWNCDDRFYSYYVAVSTNQDDWTTIVDHTNDESRGWQELLFDPLPVVYIKVVGTRNSSNEVFHVVHLEAPSNVPIAIK
uniref:BTB domain-containing protein n=1 Tax=Caenorhabditis tropicalis TaxID=1561998 RepID=A0A1I7U6P3_9PELO